METQKAHSQCIEKRKTECAKEIRANTNTNPLEGNPLVKGIKNIKQEVKEYIKLSPHTIMTSRWNQETWEENCAFRKSHPFIGCIYCSPTSISYEIPKDSTIFVLEMNNDSNRIMGIGLVRNRPVFNKFFVYDNDRYNRFVYTSKTRIDREEMNEEENRIMEVFDVLCFTGNTHMKRGQGLKTFPREMLYKMSQKLDLVEFIANMFKSRSEKKNTREEEKI
jgi:hypothetical protein